jgi:hypothetical protein
MPKWHPADLESAPSNYPESVKKLSSPSELRFTPNLAKFYWTKVKVCSLGFSEEFVKDTPVRYLTGVVKDHV